MKRYETEGASFRLGDCRKVLSDVVGKVDIVVTSPPYNIGSSGPAKLGKRAAGEYDGRSWRSVQDYEDNLDELEYQDLQKEFIRFFFRLLGPSGVLAYNHKNRKKMKFRKRGVITPWEWIQPLVDEGLLIVREEIIWNRKSTHNHDKNYLYPHSERIFVMHRPEAEVFFKNQDPSGKNKGIGDVWTVLPDSKNKHNCCFPMGIPMSCIKMWSKPGDLVCDPFSGSGTTMLACIMTGRRFVGAEKTRPAFRMAVERIKKYQGGTDGGQV